VIILIFSLFPRISVVFALLDEVIFAVVQSVKEVLQSLVDDNLVQSDKIGSSNCTVCSPVILPNHFYSDLWGGLHPNALAVFWNFPSQRGAVVSHVVSTLSVPPAAAD